jgi:peptidoglycan/xylan/chitin deacetylase (PgdA/CDA1 family)
MKFSNKNAYSIMYHYVRDRKTNSIKHLNYLTYNKFKKQINFFLKNFSIVNYDDFKEILKNKRIYKKPVMTLTFDDGYIDHYEYVFPYLLKKKIKGLFYPPAKIIEKNFVLDVNKIHHILSLVKDRKIILTEIKKYLKNNSDINFNKLNINKINLSSRFDNKETILIKRLLQYFLPIDVRKKLNNYLFKKFSNYKLEDFSKKLYMKKNHMKEMVKEGMHFGAHGNNHHWFNFITKEQQEIEIKKSKIFLKKINKNYKSLSICYPYGSYNNDTLKILKKYNFELGFTSKAGIININNNNKLLLPRFDTNDFI